MAYIGLPPKANFTSGLLDRFTSTTGTTVTLTRYIFRKRYCSFCKFCKTR